jgi:hypothetical protein
MCSKAACERPVCRRRVRGGLEKMLSGPAIPRFRRVRAIVSSRIRSSKRPGVATRISTPRASFCGCGPIGTPPNRGARPSQNMIHKARRVMPDKTSEEREPDHDLVYQHLDEAMGDLQSHIGLSHETPRWRERDSNPRSPVYGSPVQLPASASVSRPRWHDRGFAGDVLHRKAPFLG